MKKRCYNPKVDAYKYYGGRGITVCDEWLAFEAFKAWSAASGYSDGLSIERNDLDGNYEPANCRWIPLRDQQKNTKTTVRLEYNGQTKGVSEWALEFGIKPGTVNQRIRKGWSAHDALTIPSVLGRNSH